MAYKYIYGIHGFIPYPQDNVEFLLFVSLVFCGSALLILYPVTTFPQLHISQVRVGTPFQGIRESIVMQIKLTHQIFLLIMEFVIHLSKMSLIIHLKRKISSNCVNRTYTILLLSTIYMFQQEFCMTICPLQTLQSRQWNIIIS